MAKVVISNSEQFALVIVEADILSWEEDLRVDAVLLECILPIHPVAPFAMHTDRLARMGGTDIW